MKAISEQLRQAILKADESRYAISMATGIPQGNLSEFVHGKRSLSLGSVDILCKHLGLELSPSKKRK